MTLPWYRQDREAVLAALARGERPDMATTLSAGVVNELVALHEELGVLPALGAVPSLIRETDAPPGAPLPRCLVSTRPSRGRLCRPAGVSAPLA